VILHAERPIRYTPVAIALHWLIALLITATFSLGLYMTGLSLSPQKLHLYNWHKWAGVTIFLLVLLRLAWRLGHPPPALPGTMAAWERAAARWSHRLLYLLMGLVPLSGWLMSSAKGFQTVWLGVLPIPDLLSKDRPLGAKLALVHRGLGYSLAILVTIHVLAALRHHYWQRDDVLVHMLPRRRGRAEQRFGRGAR
jgi:cytochrome b561